MMLDCTLSQMSQCLAFVERKRHSEPLWATFLVFGEVCSLRRPQPSPVVLAGDRWGWEATSFLRVCVLLESGTVTLSQELEAGWGSCSYLFWVISLPTAQSSCQATRHPWARGPPVLSRRIHLANAVTSPSIRGNQNIQMEKPNQLSGSQSV